MLECNNDSYSDEPRPSKLTYDNFDDYPIDTVQDVYSDRVRRIGNYLIGPRLLNMPIKSLTQFIARKDGTNEYYTIKILTLNDNLTETEIRNGKMLLYTEFSLLNLLKGEEGIIQHHGLIKDIDYLSNLNCELIDDYSSYIFKPRKVICLVLDFLTSHLFQSNSEETHCVNLQQYVIKEKRLSEKQSVIIMHSVCDILVRLHDRNIVHRDLKLGNLILNKKKATVTLTNFCLGRHIMNDDVLLVDKRGSPAYIAPEVLADKPYKGKPVDVWAMGVVFYSMLYGEFPFYDSTPSELFRKIRLAIFKLPKCSEFISRETSILIKHMLHFNESLRFTARQTLDSLETIMWSWHRISSRANLTLQVVPSSTLAVNPTPLPIPTPPSTATPTSGAGGSAFHTVRHQRSSMGLPADHRGFSGVRPGLLVCAGLQRMIAASTEPTATPEAGGGGAGGGDDMADSYPSACPPRPVVHSLSHSPYDAYAEQGSPRLRRSHSAGQTVRSRSSLRNPQSSNIASIMMQRRAAANRHLIANSTPPTCISPTPADIPSNAHELATTIRGGGGLLATRYVNLFPGGASTSAGLMVRGRGDEEGAGGEGDTTPDTIG